MNRIILIGRLTKDPELKVAGEVYACDFTIAVNRPYAGKDGEKQADFIPCVAWRAAAQNLVKYMRKGSQICVEGSLHVDSYTAKDGTKKYATRVNAERIEFLSKGAGETQGQNLTPQDFMDKPEPVQQDPFPDFESQYGLVNDDLPF